MLTSSKLQPCLLKQALKIQKKLKELEICIKMQSIPVFPDVTKIADFQWKNADVSRIQAVCHMIYMLFGSFYGKG